MKTCPHIAGNAWMLNNEEGPSFVARFFRGGAKPPDSDTIYLFRFCPCCGVRLQEKPDQFTLLSSSARWEA